MLDVTWKKIVLGFESPCSQYLKLGNEKEGAGEGYRFTMLWEFSHVCDLCASLITQYKTREYAITFRNGLTDMERFRLYIKCKFSFLHIRFMNNKRMGFQYILNKMYL